MSGNKLANVNPAISVASLIKKHSNLLWVALMSKLIY